MVKAVHVKRVGFAGTKILVSSQTKLKSLLPKPLQKEFVLKLFSNDGFSNMKCC